MSRKEKLIGLYYKIKTTDTNNNILLGQLKQGKITGKKLDDFLDQLKTTGAKGLDKIIEFEEQLLADYNVDIVELEHMSESILGTTPTKKESIRAKYLLKNLEEIIDAMKVAYFQIRNYIEYEERLYNAKEEIQHIIPDTN